MRPIYHLDAAPFHAPRLRTLLSELGHAAIPVPKRDMEGAEYRVLDDLLASSLRPKQIILEFPQGMPGFGISRTAAVLRRMCVEEFRTFDVQPTAPEVSLLRSRS